MHWNRNMFLFLNIIFIFNKKGSLTNPVACMIIWACPPPCSRGSSRLSREALSPLLSAQPRYVSFKQHLLSLTQKQRMNRQKTSNHWICQRTIKNSDTSMLCRCFYLYRLISTAMYMRVTVRLKSSCAIEMG